MVLLRHERTIERKRQEIVCIGGLCGGCCSESLVVVSINSLSCHKKIGSTLVSKHLLPFEKINTRNNFTKSD